MTIGRTLLRTNAALIAAAILAAPGGVWAGPIDTYYERAFVVAADTRCNLFETQIGAALRAATAQARGAALRSGHAEEDLKSTAARASARAATVLCSDPQLAIVRGRVDGAFAGWARMPRMSFPGKRVAWVADRVGYERATWRLSQSAMVGATPVTLGYAAIGALKAGQTPELKAVVSFVGKSRPVSTRLVMRDPGLSPRPWLAGDGLAPVASRTSVWATGVAGADPSLLAKGRKAGEAWRFPATTAALLERLDPRETFALEFHFRDGSVATVKYEVGDFAAGRAFMAMGTL